MKRLAFPLACRQDKIDHPCFFRSQLRNASRLRSGEEARRLTSVAIATVANLSKWLTRFRVYQRLLECNPVFPVDDSEPCHGALLCS